MIPSRRRWLLLGLLALGGCSVASAQLIKNPLRYAIGQGATTFYAANGGVTSGYRCTAAAPCTLQYAIDLAQAQIDVQGLDLTISIAGGTYTQGIIVSGPLAGAGAVSGTNYVGASLILRGAGSGSTVVNASTNCSAAPNALSVGGGAYVKVASLTLQTACSGGSDIQLQQQSTVRLGDGDVQLGAASYALVFGFDRSTFIGNSTYGLKISGGATYGFAMSTLSVALLSGGAVNTISGTPAFSAFVNLIDGSMFDIGLGSSFSGAATGIRYSASLNSFIDMEDVTAGLPGNQQGNVANGSYIFNNTGDLGTCIGGAVGCAVATAPTGLGAGSAAVAPGAGDAGGAVTMTAGAGAAAAGIVHVWTPSVVAGPGHQGGFCTASPRVSGTGTWNARATVFQDYVAGNLTLQWDNNAVALVNGSTYAISYNCQ